MKQNPIVALFTPFSDKAANAKLLALCAAGALSSVATLIHDTYLPIYLSEVLGLSNTKVHKPGLGYRVRDSCAKYLKLSNNELDPTKHQMIIYVRCVMLIYLRL